MPDESAAISKEMCSWWAGSARSSPCREANICSEASGRSSFAFGTRISIKTFSSNSRGGEEERWERAERTAPITESPNKPKTNGSSVITALNEKLNFQHLKHTPFYITETRWAWAKFGPGPKKGERLLTLYKANR